MAITHSLARLALETVRLAEGQPDRASLIQPLHPHLALPYAVARTHVLTTSTFQNGLPFGVFVTITHSEAVTTKVHGTRSSGEDMCHDQVRGCLGHWNGASNPCEYQSYASVDTLLSQIVTLSCKALRRDNRTHPFTQAGEQVCADPGACVHVTLLQRPLYRIDADTGNVGTTGKPYNHRTDGILARVQHTHVATFLPNVFPNTPFHTIRDALAQKAMGCDHTLELTSELELYGYRAIVQKLRVQQRHTLSRHREKVCKVAMVKCAPAFTTAFMKVRPNRVPHTLSLTGKWITNPRDDVRNVASTCDAWHLSTVLVGSRSNVRPSAIDVRKRVRDLCVQFVVQYQRNTLSSQASVFLLVLLRVLHREKDQQESIERRLWDSLERMEPAFEQPEAFLVLVQRRNSMMRSSNLKTLRTILVNWLRKWDSNTPRESDDVFACNWQMQCLHALTAHKMSMGAVQTSLYTILLRRLLSCSATYDTSTETNYLAVAFEGLCAALGVLKQMNGHTGTHIRLAVQGVLIPLLHTRFDQKHGVYRFTDGSARLDITGHVLSGYRYLRQSARHTRVGRCTRKKIHTKPRATTHHRH